MNFQKDYYGILGIGKSATKEEIKAAFRKLAMKYHPDRNQGDPNANEKIKEINEAYEVLYSDISRHVYDEYKQTEERINQEEQQKDSEEKKTATEAASTNKRTYERKRTIRKERRVYVKGFMTAKFWAEQEDSSDLFIMKEINYKLNPVSAEATITESDIHDFNAPLNFQRAYRESELFKSPLPQPVKCKIETTTGAELYDLTLHEVRIINPALSDITKYDKQSLGTLSGEFYAYVLRIDEDEVIESVTECFGETGRIERKTEEENEFYRKEYYHKDCTKYWGPWELIRKPAPKTEAKANTTTPIINEGCLQWWWIPALLLLLFIWPQFVLGLLGIALLLFLFSAGANLLGRLLPFLGIFFLLVSVYSAIRSGSSSRTIVKRNWKPSYDTLKTTREPIEMDSINGNHDTLISHYIRWRDYDSNLYALTLSVSVSDLKESTTGHTEANLSIQSNSLSPVYNYLEQKDVSKMSRVYNAFDSVRLSNGLNDISFAQMMVTCIQSIPYYLVLDQSCESDYSYDEFIYNYLQQCNRECCIGNAKFGVRSPVEFIGDLKGDCDTRSLIIYSILKKFNYNVALLTSEYYKHALIAVYFPNEKNINGLAMNINNKNYYLWETTNMGFRPGQISPDNMNLSYWDIALLNEKSK